MSSWPTLKATSSASSNGPVSGRRRSRRGDQEGGLDRAAPRGRTDRRERNRRSDEYQLEIVRMLLAAGVTLADVDRNGVTVVDRINSQALRNVLAAGL